MRAGGSAAAGASGGPGKNALTAAPAVFYYISLCVSIYAYVYIYI